MTSTRHCEAQELADKLERLDREASPGRWFGGHLGKEEGGCQCTYVLSEHTAGGVATFDVKFPGDEWEQEYPNKQQAMANIELTVTCRNNTGRLAKLIRHLGGFIKTWNLRNVSEASLDALLDAYDSLRVDDTATDPEPVKPAPLEGDHGIV